MSLDDSEKQRLLSESEALPALSGGRWDFLLRLFYEDSQCQQFQKYSYLAIGACNTPSGSHGLMTDDPSGTVSTMTSLELMSDKDGKSQMVPVMRAYADNECKILIDAKDPRSSFVQKQNQVFGGKISSPLTQEGRSCVAAPASSALYYTNLLFKHACVLTSKYYTDSQCKKSTASVKDTRLINVPHVCFPYSSTSHGNSRLSRQLLLAGDASMVGQVFYNSSDCTGTGFVPPKKSTWSALQFGDCVLVQDFNPHMENILDTAKGPAPHPSWNKDTPLYFKIDNDKC